MCSSACRRRSWPPSSSPAPSWPASMWRGCASRPSRPALASPPWCRVSPSGCSSNRPASWCCRATRIRSRRSAAASRGKSVRSCCAPTSSGCWPPCWHWARGVYALLYRTRFGLALRAIIDSQTAAQLVGINVKGVMLRAFALASAIGGVAGFLVLAANQQVTAMFGMWATLEGAHRHDDRRARLDPRRHRRRAGARPRRDVRAMAVRPADPRPRRLPRIVRGACVLRPGGHRLAGRAEPQRGERWTTT